MDEATTYAFGLHEEATALCARLKDALARERELLIAFRVEEIPHVTLEKESLIASLVRKRTELKAYVRLRFSLDRISRLEEKLAGEEDRRRWREAEARWQAAWSETRDACRRNNAFLKESLKHLGALAENLKRCLGEHSLYNARGGRVDLPAEGKVVAASY